MKSGSAIRSDQTREEWLLERREFIGGSDIGKIVGASRWGCPRSVAYEKLGVEKDFDDSDKAEFRRGNRLEGIASEYYSELTGREVFYTTRCHVPGKKHLAISMDRVVYKKEDTERLNPGYLEVKVVGRFSMNKIKKEGIPEEWVTQVQYGVSIKNFSWGSYAIYSAEQDELIHFDVVADRELGEVLLEKADDFFNFNVLCKILPDPLPDDSIQCQGCPWSITCLQRVIPASSKEIIHRPDLEGLVAKFAEVKGLGSEAEQAEEEIKAELMAAIGEKPGVYRAGRFEFPFTITEQKRFKGELLKKKNPSLYEECRETTIVKMLKKPKEV